MRVRERERERGGYQAGKREEEGGRDRVWGRREGGRYQVGDREGGREGSSWTEGSREGGMTEETGLGYAVRGNTSLVVAKGEVCCIGRGKGRSKEDGVQSAAEWGARDDGLEGGDVLQCVKRRGSERERVSRCAS